MLSKMGFNRRRAAKKRNSKLHPTRTFIIKAANHAVDERRDKAEDEALRDGVMAIEQDRLDDWHPTGRKWYTPLKIILGIAHPAFRYTHRYLQPEDQESIADMMESYLSMLTLFYSLLGVMSVELALSPVEGLEGLDGRDAVLVLTSVSRLGWFAIGPICLTGVAAAIHVIWSMQAVPVNKRRRFLLDNQTYFSMPYAMAPPVFVLLHVSLLSSCSASILRAESKWLRYCEAIGLVVGMLPVLPLVYASGAIMEGAFRPWSQAAEVKKQADKYGEMPGETGTDTDTTDRNEGNDLRDHLSDLGLEFCLELFELQGLDWATMVAIVKNTGSFSLLDKMLGGAGLDKAGHRAAIILEIQKEIERKEGNAPKVWSNGEWT